MRDQAQTEFIFIHSNCRAHNFARRSTLLIIRRILGMHSCVLLRWLAMIELFDDLGADPVEKFFGENAQERPGHVE